MDVPKQQLNDVAFGMQTRDTLFSVQPADCSQLSLGQWLWPGVVGSVESTKIEINFFFVIFGTEHAQFTAWRVWPFRTCAA